MEGSQEILPLQNEEHRKGMKVQNLFLTLLAVSCTSGIPREAEAILANIKVPAFRPVEYIAADYGVIADGWQDNCVVLDALITRCSDDGGGRIILPEGIVLSNGPVNLKSNVNLCIPEGCELRFGNSPEYYLPGHMTVWEGTELFNYSSLIRADHCCNIAVTGRGVINGNASEGFACFRPQMSAQQDTLRQMGIDLVPVRERYFGAGSILPPNMIEPFGCKNVLIEGVTIIDSPYWCIHPLFCDNVTVRGVTIDSHNLNNDGCDPEYTTNVLIENCVFHTGDDAIAIKAGRDQDAWRLGQKTAGIVIRNCEFSSRWNGLCIGSEMAAGVENVVMYNVHVSSCASAIYFKSNLDRGGFIRNVRVDNIQCDSVSTAFIRFENNYHGGRGGNHPARYSDFHISNVTGSVSKECGFYAVGVEGVPISNVTLENVRLENCPTPYTLINTEGVRFKNVVINGIRQSEYPEDTEVVRLSTD